MSLTLSLSKGEHTGTPAMTKFDPYGVAVTDPYLKRPGESQEAYEARYAAMRDKAAFDRIYNRRAPRQTTANNQYKVLK